MNRHLENTPENKEVCTVDPLAVPLHVDPSGGPDIGELFEQQGGAGEALLQRARPKQYIGCSADLGTPSGELFFFGFHVKT